MAWLKTLKAFFGGSKKATTVLIGLFAILLRDILGLDPEAVKFLIELLLGYLLSQGAVDLTLALRGHKTS